MFYTIVLTVTKIAVIWAKSKTQRKVFQTAGTIVFMIIVIKSTNNKKVNYDKRDNLN